MGGVGTKIFKLNCVTRLLIPDMLRKIIDKMLSKLKINIEC